MDLINATELYYTDENGVMWINARVLLGSDAFSGLLSTENKETVIDSGAANNKNSHTFQDNMKQFTLRCEKCITILYSFDEDDFDANKTLTITSGGVLSKSFLNFTGKTIYFKTDVANAIIEIEEFY